MGKAGWWRQRLDGEGEWRCGYAVRKGGCKDFFFFSERAGGLPAPVSNPATITLLACSAVPLFFFIQATYHNRQATWGHQKRSLSEPHCVLNLPAYTRPLTLSCWREPKKSQRHHGSYKCTCGTLAKIINQQWRIFLKSLLVNLHLRGYSKSLQFI